MQKQTFVVGRDVLRAWGLRLRRSGFVVALALALCAGLVSTAAATTTSSSTNYSVTETQFGTGGSTQNCSTNYCAKTSTGDTAVGSTSSTSYSAQSGSNTSGEPSLSVVVTGGTQDVGVLDDTHTGTAVSTIDVTTYLSTGYVMQIVGPPPSQGTHTLRVPLGQPGNVPFTSQQGAEQFGINLVANTAPAMGADPVDPSTGTTDRSMLTANYGTPNEFAYADGDIVAQSNNGNGEINYTLSMILNVSNVTPVGRYSGVYSAVVTATF